MQRFNLVELQFRQLLSLIDCGLFRGQLRLDRIARKCQALLLDLIALLAFLFFKSSKFCKRARRRDRSLPTDRSFGVPFFACSYAECATVVFDSCSSNSRCKVARIVVSSASAAVAFDSAFVRALFQFGARQL